MFASIAAFLKSVDMVENELFDPAAMPDLFGSVLRAYYETLDRYRLLTYGQQVARAVRELEHPELAAEVHARLRHLIVDKYQTSIPTPNLAAGTRTPISRRWAMRKARSQRPGRLTSSCGSSGPGTARSDVTGSAAPICSIDAEQHPPEHYQPPPTQ